MKLLFDQNLSPRLTSLLATEYPQSEHVRQHGLATAADSAVWTFAASGGFAIDSKDGDFGQRALLHGHPPKVIWLRIGNGATAVVENILKARLPDLLSFEADAGASLLVVS